MLSVFILNSLTIQMVAKTTNVQEEQLPGAKKSMLLT
jgi:hypothetical protein